MLKNPKAEMREATIEMPSRERKIIERYTEVSVARGSGTKPFSIQKGKGTRLKDIPNGILKALEDLNPRRRKIQYSLQIVRAGLGGRLRLIVTGSAPLSNEIEEFMRVTLCAFVVQGYDQIPIGHCRQFESK